MDAKFILPVAGAVLLLLAVARVIRDGGHVAPASRTWFIVGGVFGLVSLWLWLR